MKIKKIISVIIVLSMVFCMMPCFSVNADYNNLDISGDAYIKFSDVDIKQGISLKNAQTQNVTIDGIKGKKISSGDSIYLDVDDDFNPTKWAIIITYYDDGIAEKDIVVKYTSSDSAKQLKIRKTAMSPKWVKASLFVDDAEFNGSLDYNSDIIITADSGIFSKIELVDLSDENVAVYGNITPTSVNDSKSGRTWQYMNFNGKPAIRPYVTAQGWNNEGTKFIFKSYMWVEDSGNINTSFWAMYEYDTVNSRVVMLDTYAETATTGLYAIVTPNDIIYYAKSDDMTWKMDWLTYKKQCTKAKSYGTMNVTNDGVWVTGYGGDKNYIYRSNTITGETDSINIDSAYAKWAGNSNSSGKGHPMINPVYPDLFFFCHEGSTEYIPDRLWYANFYTGDIYNMFVQVPYSSAITSETSGHEVWADDGEMMYWIKYTYNRNKGQSGMMRMDKFGSNREYINHDYNFWHCYPSSDNNFVVGDTNTSMSDVAIVSTNSYKSWRIANFSVGWSHPDQPHPHISRNNYAVNWQIQKNGVTSIGWDEVRDITLNPKEKQIIPFGDYANIITCEDAVSATTTETVDGIGYRKAEAGNGIYIDILNTVTKSTNVNATISFKYLDKGTKPIKIVYTDSVDDISELANRENKSKTVSKTNSGEQREATVNLGNINANDIGKFMSDLYFTTDGEATYISDVTVSTVDMTNETLYVTKEISTKANPSGDYVNGVCCTATHNKEDYNNILYHVDDVEGWTNAGISASTVTAAKNAGNSYVTYKYDGAWMYKDVTDANGETRTAYYAPRNYREVAMSTKQIYGNVYFRLLDDTITQSDSEVTFTIEYLDISSMTITYISKSGMSSFTISGGNTKKWKKTSVTVYDAALSSINEDTKLASGVDDVKVASNGNEMYVSDFKISKTTEDTIQSAYLTTNGVYYKSDSGKTYSCADVTNTGSADGSARVINVMYDEEGGISDISMSDITLISPGKTVILKSQLFNSTAKYRTFVWQDSLRPVKQKEKPINVNVSGSDNGIMITYNKMPGFDDVFYNIFCDGKLVERTQNSGTATLKDIFDTGHTYFVDVTDNLGKTLYRSEMIEY